MATFHDADDDTDDDDDAGPDDDDAFDDDDDAFDDDAFDDDDSDDDDDEDSDDDEDDRPTPAVQAAPQQRADKTKRKRSPFVDAEEYMEELSQKRAKKQASSKAKATRK